MASAAVAEKAEGTNVPGDIRPWPYDARYSNPGITEDGARMASFYAYQMHEWAMRGQLKEFFNVAPPKRE